MMTRARFLLLLFLPLFGAGQPAHPDNAAAQQDKPYVLLISLDGFRYDYADRYAAANLAAFGKQGVTAKALIPSFPTTTFPNHYAIATGLYPEHHGIVENVFWDPERNAQFKYNDWSIASDGNWWGGTPLWVLAEQQGMRAASFFWPGSDVEIQHTRPTYFYRYDSKIPNAQRVQQVVEWLKLPKAARPHFITLYFSDVDHEGHEHGPDAPETREAVQRVDAALGTLFQQVRALGLRLDIFVVSDHGMAAVTADIDLAKFADFSGFEVAPEAADFKIYSTDPKKIDALYTALNGKDARIAVYRRDEIPARLHYTDNRRIGDLVVLALQPVYLHAGPLRPGQSPPKGMHGYDVALVPDMRGIFFANGPDLKHGLRIEEFQNIHIYPLIAHILGLRTPDNLDGQLRVLTPILKNASPR